MTYNQVKSINDTLSLLHLVAIEGGFENCTECDICYIDWHIVAMQEAGVDERIIDHFKELMRIAENYLAK